MKFMIIAYSEALDDEVMAALDGVGGGCCYTKWTKVLGKGSRSGPHLNDHVWPKANNVLALALTGGQADGLLAAVRRLRETHGHQGIKAFILPLEEVS